MSFNKAIKHRKERRKPYRGSKRFDSRCRNNGACDWCRQNRTHAVKRQSMAAADE